MIREGPEAGAPVVPGDGASSTRLGMVGGPGYLPCAKVENKNEWK